MTTRLALRLGTIATLCALAAPAFGAESIVLMPLQLSGGLEANRTEIEAAVVKGLSVAGRAVVQPPESATARGTYVVSGNVGKEGTTFMASFRLLRTSDGYAMNEQKNHCDMADCSVAELARRGARELVRQTLGRPSEAPPPAPEPAPPKVPAPPPDSAASGSTRLGIAALAAGAVAIGVGIYFVATDGNCSSSPRPGHICKAFNDNMVGGLASIAGGVAAGALGVYLLVREGGPSGATVAVGVRPAGLVVAGRF